jgi:hypothetical protein
MKTSKLDFASARKRIIQHYENRLSAEAIADQIHDAVTSISKSFITATADSSTAWSNTRL